MIQWLEAVHDKPLIAGVWFQASAGVPGSGAALAGGATLGVGATDPPVAAVITLIDDDSDSHGTAYHRLELVQSTTLAILVCSTALGVLRYLPPR